MGAQYFESVESMKIIIDLRKSLTKNAEEYYEKAKKAKGKLKRLKELIKKGIEIKRGGEQELKKNAKKKWYEHFKWFISPKGNIVVAGKNANQNERLYRQVMKDEDLFFHADIVGAPFTIVKRGKEADEMTLKAAAQFAGSQSRAWKFGYTEIDVYYVEKEQLTKQSSGEYVKKGGILVVGERNWFRNVQLGLAVGYYGDKIACFPEMLKNMLRDPVVIKPMQGGLDKDKLAKELAEKFKVDIEEIKGLLPPGESIIVEKN